MLALEVAFRFVRINARAVVVSATGARTAPPRTLALAEVVVRIAAAEAEVTEAVVLLFLFFRIEFPVLPNR